jgi:hypothetical protein
MSAYAERIVSMTVEDDAAGTDREDILIRADRAMDIRAIYIGSAAAVTAHATNYVTISVKNGSSTIGTLALSATGLTAKTPAALTLTNANLRLASGDVVSLDFTHAGSGLATSNLWVQIEADTLG